MYRQAIEKIKVVTGLDKAIMLNKIIKDNGGLWMSIKKLYYQDDLKTGTLVGIDDQGNKYFENPYYFVPRDRWVEYNNKNPHDYDASQIHSEWHGWMHHVTDLPPTVKKPPKHEWMLPHQENFSGTTNSYVPYSTVKPKIQSWTPKISPSRRIE